MTIRFHFLYLTTLFLAVLSSSSLLAASGVIDRVEPPFWWTGFKESRLQIMFYGENMAVYEPSVDHPGISLEEVIRVQSPNYLFIYLDISDDVQAGDFEIRFASGGDALAYRYELREKSTDPNHARGFDGSDAIYLITPDRFANGDPANDAVEGLLEQPDRANKDGRHGGDIQGIADHLGYIADMGFTAIWLNPLLENDMPDFSYHGYAATDFYRVDPRYGTNEQYRDLVQSARAMGIDTIMDMIVNHSGERHWWMDDLPTEDWINRNLNPTVTSHLHATSVDPHGSEWDRRAFADGWFVVRGMPDLNQRNPLLGDYLVQNALWWIEYLGLSGIRMDTFPYPDKHYMAQWTKRVMAEYPDFNIVGEEWSSNPVVVSYWQKGQSNNDGYVSELPSLMDFPLQEALWLALTTEDGESMYDKSPGGLIKLYRMLANDILYPDPNALVIFPDNHDMDRIFTQVGHDDDLLRIALVYVLTMRGVPQIYYGTEILMANGEDKSHGTIRSDFPGGWTGDAKNAFTGAGLTENEKETQEVVRILLNWRQDKPVVHNGKTMQFSPQDATYVYFRYNDNDAVMVAINKNHAPVELSLDRFEERLDGFTSALEVIGGEQLKLGSTLLLPPRSALVLDLQ
jgi:glycosidase